MEYLAGAILLTVVLAGYLMVEQTRARRRIERLETIVRQLGPAAAARLAESPTRVTIGDKWEEWLDEAE